MHTEFLEYVQKQSNYEIMNKIKRTYTDLKGRFQWHPHLGSNGCLEFAGLLLMWNYIYETKISKYDTSYNLLFLDLMANFGLACHGMPALSWSDSMDESINRSLGLISMSEWSAVYRHLEKNLPNEIRSLEFSHSACIENDLHYSRLIVYARTWSSLRDFIVNFVNDGFNFAKYLNHGSFPECR